MLLSYCKYQLCYDSSPRPNTCRWIVHYSSTPAEHVYLNYSYRIVLAHKGATLEKSQLDLHWAGLSYICVFIKDVEIKIWFLRWCCGPSVISQSIFNLPSPKKGASASFLLGYFLLQVLRAVLSAEGGGSSRPLRPSLTKGFENRKNVRKNIRNSFFYMLARVIHAESNRVGLALLKVLAILWWEVSKPVLLLSTGIIRIFLGCCHVRRKESRKEISSYISTFHPKRRPDLFQYIASETDFEETGVCWQLFIRIPWRNGKRHWMLLPKWLVGLGEKRGRFARFPGQTRLRRCWSLLFRFFKSVCHKRWPGRDFLMIYSRPEKNWASVS